VTWFQTQGAAGVIVLALLVLTGVMPLEATVKRMQLACAAGIVSFVFVLANVVDLNCLALPWLLAMGLAMRFANVAFHLWEKQTEYKEDVK
jgi:hypothetical protein